MIILRLLLMAIGMAVFAVFLSLAIFIAPYAIVIVVIYRYLKGKLQ